jgi:hypothetical protein
VCVELFDFASADRPAALRLHQRNHHALCLKPAQQSGFGQLPARGCLIGVIYAQRVSQNC